MAESWLEAGGGLLMREAYERQLILDPESLTTTDGFFGCTTFAMG